MQDEQIYQLERADYLVALEQVKQMQAAMEVMIGDDAGRSQGPWVPLMDRDDDLRRSSLSESLRGASSFDVAIGA
jgi:hypothetical protein